jgi:hypothetical protein
VIELTEKGVLLADLDEGSIALNGKPWRIKTHLLKPSPEGELAGEVYLILIEENAATLPALLPVHSAHVGQEQEVHYRYHPYFGARSWCVAWSSERRGNILAYKGRQASWYRSPVGCSIL